MSDSNPNNDSDWHPSEVQMLYEIVSEHDDDIGRDFAQSIAREIESREVDNEYQH